MPDVRDIETQVNNKISRTPSFLPSGFLREKAEILSIIILTSGCEARPRNPLLYWLRQRCLFDVADVDRPQRGRASNTVRFKASALKRVVSRAILSPRQRDKLHRAMKELFDRSNHDRAGLALWRGVEIDE